jgi:hypothetical protein
MGHRVHVGKIGRSWNILSYEALREDAIIKLYCLDLGCEEGVDWIQLVHVCWQTYVSTVMNEPLGFIETGDVLRSLFCWVVTQCILVVFFKPMCGDSLSIPSSDKKKINKNPSGKIFGLLDP